MRLGWMVHPRVLVGAALAGAAWAGVVGFLALLPFVSATNRLIVRNAGGTDLAGLQVRLRDMKGRPSIDAKIPGLQAGSSMTFDHALNDSEAVIEFECAGLPRRFESGYIDLWTGEGWVIEIQTDGSVKQGYDGL